ncbi:MAG: ATP-binding protein [Anaerolineaceae bacterium]|nr:ATP-binding protein [Anaerolineaceae bacterium]
MKTEPQIIFSANDQAATASISANGQVGQEILDGVRLLERLIGSEIARLRASGIPVGEDEYRGLYLSEGDVDRLLAADGAPSQLEFAIRSSRADLLELCRTAGGRLGHLVKLYGLDPLETACLLLCLAPELDLRFEKLFAYLQDDVTKTRPCLELALRLFVSPDERLAARRIFSASSPLLLHHLLALQDEPGRSYSPLPAQLLTPDPAILAYLSGDDDLDRRLAAHAVLVPLGEFANRPTLPESITEQASALLEMPLSALPIPAILLSGPDALARRTLAEILAQGWQLALLAVDFPPLAAALGADLAFLLINRQAALRNAALYLDGLDSLPSPEQLFTPQKLSGPDHAPLNMISTRKSFSWTGPSLELPEPGFQVRRRAWRTFLDSDAAAFNSASLDGLAGKFRLTTTQIEAAVQSARSRALVRSPRRPQPILEDLYAAARQESTPILSDLARKIDPHYSWSDIILPEDPLNRLQEMTAQVEHRHIVYEQWGFGQHQALGKGTVALFTGSPGTGKTMAADILAGVLGLDLYRIDLSGVVSKYIGETEKNLSHVFAEAQTSNAILFFDEADALFGRRSEVRDAHDRYANIEVAYLLQKMEEYEGVVILATNLRNNLDEAFMRRMHFVIDFPLPDEDHRLRIWQSCLPAGLPLGKDVDLARLAHRFKLSGGNIRNVVLSAAFLAAADGQVVCMTHFSQAVRREFQKIGRLVPDDLIG